jgi:IclR family transcriptional regulator, KDG regulon repressor
MLEQAMEVLRLYHHDRLELRVTEVADLMGRPVSSASRLLRAMQGAGFLERDAESGRYRLGLELVALGDLAQQSSSLQRRARPHLEALTAGTGETSNLVILDGGEGVNADGVQSRQSVGHIGVVGRRLPLHATAAGKALIAWMDSDAREALPGWGAFVRFTDATLTTPDAVEAELDAVRCRGWASAEGEMERDLAAVAAPIRNHAEEVVGALVVSGPIFRLTGRRLVAAGMKTKRAAEALSETLGFGGRNR